MTENHQEKIHEPQFIPFKAETRQLLDILIHSLYTDRDVFIRELISNASDALTRLSFEMLTNRDVQDPNTELAIWISTNPEERTITIRDTGIGMTESEMVEDLGTIAHSGARTFLEAAQKGEKKITEIIGQFGVGFYSAFMAAEWIKVTSRSYRPDAETTSWFSTGGDTFSVEPAENKERGTEITIKLKEDAQEYTQEYRLRQIIKKHSDYIPYPIYLGDSDEQVNRQSAIWRQPLQEITPEEYTDFYKQFTPSTLKANWRIRISSLMPRCSSTPCYLSLLRVTTMCSPHASKTACNYLPGKCSFRNIVRTCCPHLSALSRVWLTQKTCR